MQWRVLRRVPERSESKQIRLIGNLLPSNSSRRDCRPKPSRHRTGRDEQSSWLLLFREEQCALHHFCRVPQIPILNFCKLGMIGPLADRNDPKVAATGIIQCEIVNLWEREVEPTFVACKQVVAEQTVKVTN